MTTPVDIFWSLNLPPGRRITAAKHLYKTLKPDARPVWGAHIFTKTHGRVWFGDLDLSIDLPRLVKARASLGEDIYVLSVNDWSKKATHTVWSSDPNQRGTNQ